MEQTMPLDFIPPLLNNNGRKIILLVLDGLGGLSLETGGKTELETAHTPHMDTLSQEGSLGETIPIRPGITPGSGPAHLAMFGYDPLTYDVGRGALEATGAGMRVDPGDVAARGNFCTLDSAGKITDRRAGRISGIEAEPAIRKLQQVSLPGVEIEVKQLKEYRFAVVMRGEGLSADIADTDPQRTGVAPLAVTATHPASKKASEHFQQWVQLAQSSLRDHPQANGLTLRGFGTDPELPQYADVYGLHAACVAVYPMYRGVSKLVGMNVIEFEGEQPADEFAAVAAIWDDYDFFFVHIKKTDSMGEDGNFDGKVKIIESVDQALPELLQLDPEVIMITGDHSTPARMKSHSWHPVPFLMWSKNLGRADQQSGFGERACAQGGLGTLPATDIMALALAHAGRLQKYGA